MPRLGAARMVSGIGVPAIRVPGSGPLPGCFHVLLEGGVHGLELRHGTHEIRRRSGIAGVAHLLQGCGSFIM